MKSSIRVKTKKVDKITKVKILIRHPMETGLRKEKKSGKTVPAHFIKEVTCKHNSKTVFSALWGIAVSQNPYLSFTLSDVRVGDVLTVAWVDNQNNSDRTVVNI